MPDERIVPGATQLMRMPDGAHSSESVIDKFSMPARAASQAVRHLAEGSSVGLRTDREVFAPDFGPRHRRQLLSHLALIEANS